MAFVWHDSNGRGWRYWYPVRILGTDEELEKAKSNKGRLVCRFYVRHYKDSEKLTLKDCRYWPEVHEYDERNDTLTKMIACRPNRFEKMVGDNEGKYRSYQIDIDVCKHIIHGPFEFATPPTANGRSHTFRQEDWAALRRLAPEFQVDPSDLDEVVPLQ